MKLQNHYTCCKRNFNTYLNSITKPYTSTHMPIKGQPSKTVRIPPKNAPEPFHLWRWKKKRNVRSKPTTNARPAKNKICYRDVGFCFTKAKADFPFSFSFFSKISRLESPD